MPKKTKTIKQLFIKYLVKHKYITKNSQYQATRCNYDNGVGKFALDIFTILHRINLIKIQEMIQEINDNK